MKVLNEGKYAICTGHDGSPGLLFADGSGHCLHSCWVEMGSSDCQMVEMELHRAGSRVVTAEALVIEKGLAQQIIAREVAGYHMTSEDAFNTAAIIVNALAQSKEGE